MDSSLWKINGTPAAELGLKDFDLTLVNQQPDRLIFNADGRAFDSEALFDYGTAFSLHKGDVRWFQGVVLSGPRFGAPDRERHDYEVAGLWWYLEQLVFEQEWRSREVNSLNKSHVILGMDIDNNHIPIGAVIKEALDQVIENGAPFAYDQEELDLLAAVPPADEQSDLACSEVITKMLRWMPDVTTWFDYAEDTPILHFTRRGNAPSIEYNCTAGDPAEKIEISRRDDLVQSGVIIKYERFYNIDGEMWPQLYLDTYPEGTERGFDTASFTINIAGAELVTQHIEIRAEGSGGEELVMKHLPYLAPEDINVTSPGGNILADGEVPEWLGENAWETTVTGEAKWTDDDGSQRVEKVSAKAVATSAKTGSYDRIVSFTPADPVPVGLAQALYEALSVVHFQGRFGLLENECSMNARVGTVLNLSGGLPEWATMRAVVQQVGFDIDSGRTSITFGPPEHLSPQDHITLLNVNRRRTTLYSGTSRGDGTASGSSVKTGGATANSSGASSTRYRSLVVKGENGKKITLDPATIIKGMVLVADDNGAKFGYIKWR